MFSNISSRSRIEKKIIEISSNKFRITYNSSRIFSVDESNFGPVDEPLNVLNPIVPSLIENLRNRESEMDASDIKIMFMTMSKLQEKHNETLIINSTARELLLGRKSSFLQKLSGLSKTFGEDMPLADGRFGYISSQNATSVGPIEIYTGYQDTVDSLGNLISYQGKQKSTVFKGRCSRIQTSVGELRPSPIASNQTLEMFRPEFGRILRLKPTGTRRLPEGNAISYVFSEDDFQSPQKDPERQCYCIQGLRDNYCSLNGALELAPVARYAPIVISLNHLELDPKITNSVEDWDAQLTDSNIDTEPQVDKSSQMLILKSLGIPIHLDFTVIFFIKVVREERIR